MLRFLCKHIDFTELKRYDVNSTESFWSVSTKLHRIKIVVWLYYPQLAAFSQQVCKTLLLHIHENDKDCW